MIDINKPRITEKVNKYKLLFGYEPPYARLQELENAIESGELVPVVRCGECVWWRDRQVKLSDGTYRDYKPDEPWSVTADVGINVGSHCTKHGFENESGSWFWTNENDYCSRGTKLDGKDGEK